MRELGRAIVAEARRIGGAIEMLWKDGRVVGFGVVPDPSLSADEKKEWAIMAWEGVREIRATEVGVSATKAGREGKPFVAVQVRVSPGQGEGSGRRYTWRGWLDTSEKRERTVKALRAMGWAGSTLAALKAGKLEGLGSRTALCEFKVERNPNDQKEYTTPAFVSEIPRLKLIHDVDVTHLEGNDFIATAHTDDGEVIEDEEPYPAQP